MQPLTDLEKQRITQVGRLTNQNEKQAQQMHEQIHPQSTINRWLFGVSSEQTSFDPISSFEHESNFKESVHIEEKAVAGETVSDSHKNFLQGAFQFLIGNRNIQLQSKPPVYNGLEVLFSCRLRIFKSLSSSFV